MGRYLSIPVLGLAAILSASVIPQAISFVVALLGNITPILANTRGQVSLVMLFVLCWSIRAELLDSLIWALVGGLALDLLSILPLGASSVALLLIAFSANVVAQQLFRIRVLFLVAATPIATAFFTLYTFFALSALGASYDFMAMTSLLLIPTILYNLLAVIPLYALVRLIQRRLEGGLQIAPQSLTQASTTRAQE